MERSRLVTGSVSIHGACLATGRILCRPSYSFPASISPIDSTDIYDKSLYEAEESGNKFETELIQAITGLPNIRWWHRNIVRTGFAINGFINHYPDFIVRTRSGKIVIIETKGDYRANEETLAKLHLGRAWQEQAGPGYRYFLVFQDKLRRDRRNETSLAWQRFGSSASFVG